MTKTYAESWSRSRGRQPPPCGGGHPGPETRAKPLNACRPHAVWETFLCKPGPHQASAGVFDAELFALLQALRLFDGRGEAGRRYTMFSDSEAAIRRI